MVTHVRGHWFGTINHTTRAQVAGMMGGVEVDGVLVKPEEISTLEGSLRLRVVVAEGKKHEVRGHVRGSGGDGGGGVKWPLSAAWRWGSLGLRGSGGGRARPGAGVVSCLAEPTHRASCAAVLTAGGH